MNNWTESGEPIITDNAKGNLSSFVEQIDFRLLSNGICNLIFSHLIHERDRELWFDDFLLEVSLFYHFIDGLEEEYKSK